MHKSSRVNRIKATSTFTETLAALSPFRHFELTNVLLTHSCPLARLTGPEDLIEELPP
jgi:hypothetical protein